MRIILILMCVKGLDVLQTAIVPVAGHLANIPIG